jgi:hypothetical protein
MEGEFEIEAVHVKGDVDPALCHEYFLRWVAFENVEKFRFGRDVKYLTGNSPNPYSRALEKLTVPQIVKKFPVFLWNLNAHYRVDNSPSPVSTLSQINPVHALPTDF